MTMIRFSTPFLPVRWLLSLVALLLSGTICAQNDPRLRVLSKDMESTHRNVRIAGVDVGGAVIFSAHPASQPDPKDGLQLYRAEEGVDPAQFEETYAFDPTESLSGTYSISAGRILTGVQIATNPPFNNEHRFELISLESGLRTVLETPGGPVRSVSSNASGAYIWRDESPESMTLVDPDLGRVNLGGGTEPQLNLAGTVVYKQFQSHSLMHFDGNEIHTLIEDELGRSPRDFYLADDDTVYVRLFDQNSPALFRIERVDLQGNVLETISPQPGLQFIQAIGPGHNIQQDPETSIWALYLYGDQRLFGEGDDIDDRTVCDIFDVSEQPFPTGALAVLFSTTAGTDCNDRTLWLAKIEPDADRIAWANGDGGNFTDPSNWRPAIVPGLENPDATAAFSLDRVEGKSLARGLPCDYDVFGNSSSVGRVVADGDCIVNWQLSGQFETTSELQTSVDIGRNGTLNINSGRLVSRGAVIGSLGTSDTLATMQLSGLKTIWTVQRDLRVGESSPGHLLLLDGAELRTEENAFVGPFAEGSVILSQDSLWTSRASVRLGSPELPGAQVTVLDGSHWLTESAVRAGEGGASTIEVTAGLWTAQGLVDLGFDSSGVSITAIRDGGSAVFEQALTLGENGLATLQVQGVALANPSLRSEVEVRSLLAFASSPGAIGGLHISAGARLETKDVVLVGPGESTITLEGCDESLGEIRNSVWQAVPPVILFGTAASSVVNLSIRNSGRMIVDGASPPGNEPAFSLGLAKRTTAVIGDDQNAPVSCQGLNAGSSLDVWGRVVIGAPLEIKYSGSIIAQSLLIEAPGVLSGEGCVLADSSIFNHTECRVNQRADTKTPQPIVLDGGVISPGSLHRRGKLTLNGGLRQVDGVVELTVVGAGAEEQDMLEILGDVDLSGGRLQIEYAGGYGPTAGTQLAALTGGEFNISQDFEVTVVGLEPGFEYQSLVKSGQLILEALTDGTPNDSLFESDFEF